MTFLGAHGAGRLEPGGLEDPRHQRRMPTQRTRLPGQDGEYVLRDFLGQLTVLAAPQRAGVDEIAETPDQGRERRLATSGAETLPKACVDQFCVVALSLFAPPSAGGPRIVTDSFTGPGKMLSLGLIRNCRQWG